MYQNKFESRIREQTERFFILTIWQFQIIWKQSSNHWDMGLRELKYSENREAGMQFLCQYPADCAGLAIWTWGRYSETQTEGHLARSHNHLDSILLLAARDSFFK